MTNSGISVPTLDEEQDRVGSSSSLNVNLPKTNDIVNTLEHVKTSEHAAAVTRNMSPQGQKVMKDVQKVIGTSQKVLLKNQDDHMQNMMRYAYEATKLSQDQS